MISTRQQYLLRALHHRSRYSISHYPAALSNRYIHRDFCNRLFPEKQNQIVRLKHATADVKGPIPASPRVPTKRSSYIATYNNFNRSPKKIAGITARSNNQMHSNPPRKSSKRQEIEFSNSLKKLISNREVQKAEELLLSKINTNKIDDQSVHPNIFHFAIVINGWVRSGAVGAAERLLQKMA